MNRMILVGELGGDHSLLAGISDEDPDAVWVLVDGIGGGSARLAMDLAEAVRFGEGLVKLVRDSAPGS